MTSLIQAAIIGYTGIVRLLLGAGADVEAKDKVSKRISICLAHVCVCVCVCVIFFYDIVWSVKSVVLFYSSISLLWYVGYDDLISMGNVFVSCSSDYDFFACVVAWLYEDECIW